MLQLIEGESLRINESRGGTRSFSRKLILGTEEYCLLHIFFTSIFRTSLEKIYVPI